MSLVRRYPLISFFVLAYALAWWIWILYAFEITFLGPIFALGSFLAAIIVTALTHGKAGLKALLRLDDALRPIQRRRVGSAMPRVRTPGSPALALHGESRPGLLYVQHDR